MVSKQFYRGSHMTVMHSGCPKHFVDFFNTLWISHDCYAFWIAESVACIYINNNGIHGFYYDYNIAQNALTFQRKSDLLSSENK